MIIELLKRDGTYYEIQANFPSLGMLRPPITVNVQPIARSFRDGSIFVGERNAKGGEITLSIDVQYDTDVSYRGTISALVRHLRETEYIVDTENDVRTRVEFAAFQESPDASPGTINRSSKITITFIQLDPFWEDETVTTIGPVSGLSIAQAVDNTGDLPVPLFFSCACDASPELGVNLDIQTEPLGTEPVLGVFVDLGDNNIASTNFTITVDNDAGAVYVNEGTPQLITNAIAFGSGFFDIPVGETTVNVILTGGLVTSMATTITYRKRYSL